MTKVGRKPALSPEDRNKMMAEYARYQRVQKRYERLMRKLSPQAIGRKYKVSTSTVLDYGRGRRKGEVNYGRPMDSAMVRA